MADFELNINARAFSNRGVRVAFDESRYGALLDQLVEFVPQESAPILNIWPVSIWNPTFKDEFLANMARTDIHPRSHYHSETRTLSLFVDENEPLANSLLLRKTREWAGDLNGELATHRQDHYERRNIRRAYTLGTVGVAAATGMEIEGGVTGAVVGGITGFIANSFATLADTQRQPYNRAVSEFIRDPQVLVEYGQILRYEPA